MTAAQTPSVFISYRREGTAMHAGRLYDAMAARFGEHNVFMDLEMAPGIDFVERITTAVGSCRALLVVIGPGWMGDGGARIADPADFVRLEVETALRAADVTVIPVLVEGARMPAPEQLPAELRPLARRNAIELSDLRWRYDCQRLMTALDDLLGEQAGVPAGRDERRARSAPVAPASVWALVPLWLEGVAVAVAAGLLVRWALADLGPPDDPTEDQMIAGQIQLRAVCWAVVVAALAIWLTLRRGDRGRLLRRTAMGLLLGGLAGALGGGLWSLLCFVLNDPSPIQEVAQQQQERMQIAALALTGGIVGIAVGMLWIPPRALAGCLAGAVGAGLVQVATNALEHPPGAGAFALNCFAIVGATLLVLLLLAVRAAVAVRRTGLAAEPVAS
ncbi:MAG TPA: toll/interleukin-1 receptor domain-containing protein [Conexibacter sp.]|nr:toll/interleukin-1 receptor domain-containing protein [Conexibacter sp.]